MRPLTSTELTSLHFDPPQITDGLNELRTLQSLTTIIDSGGRRFAATDFWDSYDDEQARDLTNLWRALRRKKITQVNEILDRRPELIHATNTTSGDWTVIGLAIAMGNHALVERCLQAGYPIDGLSAGLGNQVLHEAAYANSSPHMIDYLISAGANINAINTDRGQTPLHYAVLYRRYEALDNLLNRGADPTIADATNLTALDHARSLRHEAMIVRLERALADHAEQ